MSLLAGNLEHVATTSRAATERLESVVTTFLPLVRRLARSVHVGVSGAVELDDLVQVGLAALVEASRAFVDRGEARFETYASIRIRGAMVDETRKLATVSRQALRRRRDLQAMRSKLHGEMGRAPTIDELAKSCGLSIRQFEKSVDAQEGICFRSLDESYSDRNPSFADPSPTADCQLEAGQSAEALTAAIAMLPERYQMVLQLCFVEEVSLAEIGQILGVGAARVCQIKKIAFARLRDLLSDDIRQ